MGKADRTKQFIIEEAAVIFNKKGVAGTTVDDVLKAANVARGCLYGHFENKDELAYETADHLLKKSNDRMIELLARKKSAKSKIMAYLNFNENPLLVYADGGSPVFNMAVEADDNNPVVRDKIKKVIEMDHLFFVSIFETGKKNGEFSKDLNAEDFAYRMLASIEGAIVVCRILNSNRPMQYVIKSLKADLLSYKPV